MDTERASFALVEFGTGDRILGDDGFHSTVVMEELQPVASLDVLLPKWVCH